VVAPAPATERTDRTDLPVGGYVLRNEGLVWRRRVDWTAPDYQLQAQHFRTLAKHYMDAAAAVDAERVSRFGKED